MSSGAPTAPATPHWQRGRVTGWLFATDHKRVGILWLGLAGAAAVLAAVLAVLAAIQTATSDASFLGEGTYVSLRTLESTLLQYFVVVPLVVGLAVYLVPLLIGARGIAARGFVSAGFWLAAFGGLTVVVSPLGAGDAPRSWWTTVPSLVVAPDRPSEGIRTVGLVLLGVGLVFTVVAIVLTIHGRRAPGMTLERMPLFAQGAGIYAAACLVLAPVFVVAQGLLLLARGNPGDFDWYLTEDGLGRGWGWLFAQGIVAVAVVPALAAAGEIVSTFARRPLRSRRAVTWALVAAGALLAVLPSADDVAGKRWAAVLAVVASAALAVAAVPLLAEGGRALRTERVSASPLPYALASLVLIVVAAIVALLFALRHDELAGTVFATARVEALWCASVLTLAGALVYWWPKLLGRLLDPRLTGLAFVLAFGSSLLLVVGHAVAGEQGQAARTAVTSADASAAGLVASLGVFGLAAGLALFALAVARSGSGRRAGNDPWHGDTLEWFVSSPPPPGNFETVPPVASPRPLDDLRATLREKGAL